MANTQMINARQLLSARNHLSARESMNSTKYASAVNQSASPVNRSPQDHNNFIMMNKQKLDEYRNRKQQADQEHQYQKTYLQIKHSQQAAVAEHMDTLLIGDARAPQVRPAERRQTELSQYNGRQKIQDRFIKVQQQIDYQKIQEMKRQFSNSRMQNNTYRKSSNKNERLKSPAFYGEDELPLHDDLR